MFFTIDNEIKISYPTPEVLKAIKRDLTFANPDYVNRKRMGKWTGNVPREICLYSEEGDDYEFFDSEETARIACAMWCKSHHEPFEEEVFDLCYHPLCKWDTVWTKQNIHEYRPS